MSKAKRQLQRRLERDKLAIERRLGAAVGRTWPAAASGTDPLRVGRARPGGRAWWHRDDRRLVEAVGLACEIDASSDC